MVATTDGVASLVRPVVGRGWEVDRRSLGGKHISAMIGDPSGRVFAGVHGGGIYRSQDGGASWQPAATGLRIDHVYSLAIAEDATGAVLYAGTEPVSLFRSRDHGDRWEELPAIGRMPGAARWSFPPPPHLAHTKWLCIDAGDPGRIYAAVEQGALLRTEDGGESWVELDDYSRPTDVVYRDVHRVVQAPWARDTLFMTTGVGFYRSTDAGERWEPVDEITREIGYPDCMVASPRGDRTLLVAGARSNPFTWLQSGQAEGTVFRSRDDGRSWEPANRGLPAGCRANVEAMTLVSHPGGVSVFVGDTDGSIFSSDDLGDHWSRIAGGLSPVSKAGHHALLRTASAIPRWARPAVAAVATTGLRMSAYVASRRRAG